jgi:hypothetical protein
MRKTTGIRARHARSCCGEPCRCQPSYEAFVYDRRTDRKIRGPSPRSPPHRAGATTRPALPVAGRCELQHGRPCERQARH